MKDLDWYDYLAERDEFDPFSQDELPRAWREAYTERQDLTEAA